MEGVAQYMAESDDNHRGLHGLEVGDTVESGWSTDTVVEIDDEGVRFDDGETANHITVARNLSQIRKNNDQ